MKQTEKFAIINNPQNNMLPVITEDTKTRHPYVPFGVYGSDDFFEAITSAYNVSTTNAACVEGLADLIFGKGIYDKDESKNELLQKILPSEELKRVSFDLKLYGNAAFQVYWDDTHTKVIKLYHVPIQYLRAEKLYSEPKVQNYYYCTNWFDQRAMKNKKKIPAFGTSKDKFEILYIKNYCPGLYYYSLPDWVSAVQFSLSEGEISNLHYNNITNGFLPSVMINFNNGVPAPEERQTIEDLLQAKFTGTDNAGRFMVSFNDDAANKPTLDVINIDNLHEKYQYVAEYIQDRILVAHRVTSPLLFGIRDKGNGFSSQSEEMMTAFSILQSMTINPFQNLLLNSLDMCLSEGGHDFDLYFEQLTPLVLLSKQAEEQGKSIQQVEDETNKALENPATTEDAQSETIEENVIVDSDVKMESFVKPTFFEQEYEILNR